MRLNLERRLPQAPGSDHSLLERSDESDEVDSEQQSWEVVVKMDGRSRPEPLTARRIGGASEGTATLSWSVATGNGTYVAPEPSRLTSVGLMDLDV